MLPGVAGIGGLHQARLPQTEEVEVGRPAGPKVMQQQVEAGGKDYQRRVVLLFPALVYLAWWEVCSADCNCTRSGSSRRSFPAPVEQYSDHMVHRRRTEEQDMSGRHMD